MRRKILKTLGKYFFSRSVMLSLSFAQKEISRVKAWEIVGGECRRLENAINQHRRRKGIKKAVAYFRVLESGEAGYPHAHVVYPGLKYLADWRVIKSLWGHGSIDISYGKTIKPASYACKYITKMGGNDLQMAFMKWFKVRLYNFSRGFKYLKIDKEKGWCVYFGELEGVRSFIGLYCEDYEVEEGKVYNAYG